MDLTFYMTVNEEAALNKEISMPATKSIAFLSNTVNYIVQNYFFVPWV